MQGFLDAIDSRVLVCDGAMGTMLYSKGIFLNRCFDELNLTQADLVAEVHREYVRAGADVVETNTFGANRFKLASFGLADKTTQLNAQGARIARHAARDRVWVAGAMGPLGVRIEPWGRTGVQEAEDAFREQALALAGGGVDLFMLETFRDLNELVAAVTAVRSVSTLPIVAQMTTDVDGNSLDGTPPATFAPALERAGADVIGVNCSVGPAAMLETIEAIARVSGARLAAQPNAGRPRDVEGRNLYLCSPDYMATYARRFIGAGARLVGGCCGTTPDHIRQIAQAVRTMAPATVRPARDVAAADGTGAVAAVDRRDKSGLARALADGEFVIVMEVSTPRGLDLRPVLDQARHYRDLGAVAVNVPDYPKSGARASAMALAVLLEQHGLETMLHYSCRDRHLIGMQSDLIGAHAMGLRNVLVTTGNPPPQSAIPDATSVFDVDAIGLANMVTRLNHGQDIGGQPIGAPTEFHIGAAVNPFAPDVEAEWRRLMHKVEAGAEYLVTPPIFDLDAFAPLLERLHGTGLPVLAGLAAIDGLRHAEFLASEVIGVRIPDSMFDRLRQAADQGAEALAVMVEIAAWLRTRVSGLQITSWHGTPEAASRLLAAIGVRSAGAGAGNREVRHA
ncbi:MAG TPA: bifunctional homocysteine S-methyltransferase/methylenetetrahydrofolate reductase [Vicinamibacterales bacterium]|nr:bifunctional homocysteine S-methyltransferase/methylenetetrahydrofolate reductase [Vicinamibacterales bacterium]